MAHNPSNPPQASLINQPASTPKTTHLCQICTTSTPAKYTCPRCHTHTCSLLCSTSHKTQTGCTGIRNKGAYVPMNGYSWGSMMDDYCFLEDIGRKVGEWGREIVQSGFDMSGAVGRGRGRGGAGNVRGRGRGRGRGGGGKERGGRGRGGKGKRELLKAQLEMKGIEMEILPPGMERSKLNQSAWDLKKQTGFLTIQFRFHPSAEARSTSKVVQSFTLLTHRNSLSTPLLSLVQNHIRDRLKKRQPMKKKTDSTTTTSAFPPWIPPLVLPPPEDPDNFTTPHFVITAPSDPLLTCSSTLQNPYRLNAVSKPQLYHSIDPGEPLLKSLNGIQFVEFPLIEIWEEFTGTVVDKKTGGIGRIGKTAEPQRKRRKLDPEEGRKTISGLVGDYGSEEEGNEEENGVGEGKLVEYMESEGDEEDDGVEQDNVVDEEIVVGEDDEEDDEDEAVDIDASVLFELMRQSQKEEEWSGGERGEGDDVLSS